MAEPEGSDASRFDAALVVAAPVLALALYARTVGFAFVWDDRFLTLLPVYASGDWSAVLLGPGNGLEYLPVRDLSLMLDHALAGAEPALFHATQVVLFALATLVVGCLYRSLGTAAGAPRWVAGAAACLFAVHPLQVEPVAFVTGRNALLALLFSAAALLLHDRALRLGKNAPCLASLACMGLALLSKATAVSLPGLLLLLEWTRRRDRGLRGAAVAVSPHLALGLAVAALHLWMARVGGVLEGPVGPANLLERLPVAFFVPVFYLGKFLWPLGLTIEYRLAALTPVLAFASVLAVGACVVAVLGRAGRWPWLAFLVAGFGVALVPVSNLVPTSPLVADRYAQLALVFLAPLPFVALAGLPRGVALPAALALVVACASLSHRQVGVWRDDVHLFAHAVEVDPAATGALANLATRLFEEGRTEEAVAAAMRLEEVAPEDPVPDRILAGVAAGRGDFEEAERRLRRAAGRDGTRALEARLDLADLLSRLRRDGEARAAYQQVLEAVEGQAVLQALGQRAERGLHQLALRGGSR